MKSYRVNIFIFLLSLLLLSHFTSVSEAQPEKTPSASEIILILDASGSMWGQIEGENKISIAKTVLKNLVSELPDNTEVGLIAYGHREKGDCKDIETIVPPSPLDKALVNKKIEELNPKGKTPITDSVLSAFDLVRANENATTVILVSDGIETCGGDPCKAVKEAKDSGINFVMHVVGFDVGDVDVSQLECAAQVGGGLYMSAQNASELSEALETAVEIPAELPVGKLSVKVTAAGKLQDSMLVLTNTKTGEALKGQRTYSNANTNPRVISLPDGVYDLEIRPQGMKGVQSQTISAIEIKEGEVVEKVVDFGFGELSVKVVRNNKLMDSTVHVYNPDTEEVVAKGRTYNSSNNNPIVIKIEPGVYDVVIKALEIETKPSQTLKAVEILSGETVEKIIDYSSGTLKVGALQGEKLLDSVVNVTDQESGVEVAKGRTYVNSNSNPKVFELAPGIYNVSVKPLGIEGSPSQIFEGIEILASETIEKTAQFTSGTLKVGAFQGEKLLDAVVNVSNPESGQQVAKGRTYKSSNSNPKVFELPPGIYDISVKALGITNNPILEFKAIEIQSAETVVKEAQFSSGSLKIGALEGEKLVDASVSITDTQTGEKIANGRTYKSSKSNPKVFELIPGIYNIEVKSLAILGHPISKFESVEIKPSETVEETARFSSGVLEIVSKEGESFTDSMVSISNTRTGEKIASGRTYDKPKSFILIPGSYTVTIRAIKIEGGPEKTLDVEVKAQETSKADIDFSK